MSESDLLEDDARRARVRTLVELVEYRAARQPHDTVFRFLNGEGVEESALTFAQLRARSALLGARLREHCVPGDRVLLLVPPGEEYPVAFFGCHYAGAVAVPAYPPNPRRADPRVARIVLDCGAAVALAPASFLARLESWLALVPELRALTWLDAGALAGSGGTTSPSGSGVPPLTGSVPAPPAPPAPPTPADPADPAALAMLQYTSGSTGEPRGVMITHANLLHNSAIIHRVSRHRRGDNGVFWLPPFHDMGLIGGIVQPLYAGCPAALMAPATFLQRPLVWLQALSRYRATTSGAPNFAYDLCVDRVGPDERATLDLSAWRTSFNGAEPIRAASVSRFEEAFAVSGLRRHVVMPSYGLAEATLFVSGGPPGVPLTVVHADRRALEAGAVARPADTVSAVTLVASGEIAVEQEVAIVDPDAPHRCAHDEVGEIWVSGESVAQGYWNRPAESAATFHAHLTGSPRPWLRTGDLGVVTDGALLVTGRLKDLVILEGRNYYPHDIETAAERCHASLRPGYSAAFSVPQDGRERLALVLEVTRHHTSEGDAALFQAVRREIAHTVGIVPHDIVLVRPNSIPRTSSGKIQRRACRDALRDGSLDIVGRWRAPAGDAVTPRDAITAWMLDWVRDELSVDPALLVPATRLRDLGLDSLAATRMIVALEERFGRRIDPAQLWATETVGAFAEHVATLGARSDGVPRPFAIRRAPYGAPSASSTDIAAWPEYRALRARLDSLTERGIASPFFHVHEGVTGAHTVIGGRTLVNFANYNYLGLSGHPDVTRAAQEAAARWGTSVSASRVVSGERPVHRALEREIARFVGAADAIVYIGGVTANVSTLSHLMGPEDVVLCDALVHNSAMQGAEFSGARRLVFPHADWRALDQMLGRVRAQHRRALVVIEGVYSADGDVPDLARFVEVKSRHHALLMVDEAHSLGTLGATGRGIAEHAGVDPRAVEIWMGTLSKSLASCGGYIAGSAALVEYLKYTSPGFVFSVGITPGDAAAALAALLTLQREPERVQRLQENAALFLTLCRDAGLDTGASAGTPVIPVIVGDSLRAARLSDLLFSRGINVQPMVAPSVPNDRARLRFFVSAEHTERELREAATRVAEAVREVCAAPTARTEDPSGGRDDDTAGAVSPAAVAAAHDGRGVYGGSPVMDGGLP